MEQWNQNRGASVAKPSSRVVNQTISERVQAFVHAHYRQKPVEAAAHDLRVSADTLRTLFRRGSAPSARLLTKMICVWGPDFMAAVLPGCQWLDEAAARERHARLERQQAALALEIEGLRHGLGRPPR